MTDEAAYNLTIEDHAGQRTVLSLDLQAGAATIGRLEANTVHLADRNVSRRHARLFLEGGRIVVEDLDSYNGLWVGDDRVEGQRSLTLGQMFRIGDFVLLVHGEAPAALELEATQRHVLAAQALPVDESTQPGVLLPGGGPPAGIEPTSLLRLQAEAPLPPPPDATVVPLVPVAQRGRLICVSTQYAGNTFELLRAETVVGRVEENDIAIDHRSVSRHHAKLLLQGEAYRVVDLQSANGTLVNGEAYAQSDLKHGDLLELGHVKLRFVAPGQTYVLSPAEQRLLARIGRAGRRSRWRYAAWASALVASVLLAYAIVSHGVALREGIGLGESRSEAVPTAVPPAADATAPPPLAPVAPPPRNMEVEHLLDQAHTALQQRQWRRAEALYNAVLALDAGNPQAEPMIRQAQNEMQAQHSFDRAVSATGQSQWYDAWNSLQEIGKDSTYAPQAVTLLGQIRPALMTAGLAECRAALQREAFDAAAAQLDELEGLEAGRPEVAELRAALDEARRRRGASDKRHAKGNGHKSSRPDAAAAAHPPEEGAQQAYADALAALKVGNLQQAVDDLNRCLQADKNFSSCYRALGIAYAKMGNGPRAVRFYRLYLKADPQARDAAQVRELLQKYEVVP